ncbi:MAG: hypothetical protein WKF72_05760 [Nocardioidaceae bacterium]
MSTAKSGPAPPAIAEVARLWLAPPVALLASCLALVCLTSVPDVVTDLEPLSAANERFVGWAGVGLIVALAVAAVGVLTAPRVGPGPALSLGAAAAVFGLALGSDIVDDLQAGLAFCLLGLAVGGLVSGAACMSLELDGRWRSASLIAWVVPLAAGWPMVTWVALHDAEIETGRIALHPSVWVLAPVSAVLVLWSVLSMLIEPVRVRRASEAAWESAWSSLLTVCGVTALLIMVLGFDPEISAAWLRPLVIVVTAALVVALVGVVTTIPTANARMGYVCVAVTGLCLPTCLQLAVVVSDAGQARVGWPVPALLALMGVVGVSVGWMLADRVVWPAFIVVAGAAAGSWVMADGPWVMFASAAPLTLGAGAAIAAGIRLSSSGAMELRYAAMTVVGVIMIGVAISIPLGWSLGGAVASNVDDARAAGRVLFGLTFAAAVLAAGYTATLRPRVGAPGARSQHQSIVHSS